MRRRGDQTFEDYERQELARLDGQREGDEGERAELELWMDRYLDDRDAAQVEARRAALRARQRRAR